MVSTFIYGQKLPNNPNTTDKNGLRQGKWTITYDKYWVETKIADKIAFYRLITYKDDKPIGKVTDYYLSGKVQMEATLLADRPQEVFEGVVTWYREDGTKETERTFEKGKQISEKNFDAQGKEIDDTKSWKRTSAKGIEFYQKGDCQNAAIYFEKALPLAEKEFGKESRSYAIICNNLAELYKSQGLYGKAEPLCIEAKNIREKVLGKEHPDYARSCNNLAVLYQSQGLYGKAEPLYIEAKNIREKVLGKDHPAYATSCSNLATLYYNQGLYAQAEPLYIEGIKPLLSQIENNFSTLSEKEKGLFYKSFSYHFELFNSFATKRYKENPAITAEVYNNTLATKALLFNASDKMRSRILNSKDEKLVALFEEWKAKKGYLIKVYEMTLEQKKKNNIDVSKLENEANELEKQLSQKSEIFATLADKKRYTWTDVQKKLQKNEVAIEIIRFQVYDKKWTDSVKYMALLIKPESKYPEMVVLENGNELEGQYAQYYQKMIKDKFEDAHSHAQYWRKIEDKLGNVKKVYLSVDGVYNSLSMNTLFDTTNKKYLFEKYDIELLTNTKDLCTRKTNGQKTIKKGHLIGFPDYNNDMKEPIKENEEKDIALVSLLEKDKKRFFDGKDIENLPETKVEIENLSKTLVSNQITANKLMGKDATESNLKNIKFPEILHIATHGFFLPDTEKDKKDNNRMLGMDSKKVFENPLLRSGLLFANAKNALKDGGDGVLTAFEAMNLDLDNTEIVVMSACETGLGEVRNGEGVYGLQRAFQTAGAKTILMSLWKVSDNTTQELMTLFYENWIGKKQSKREAFKNAQNTLRKNYPHPYYWGAFVMVGE